jgi:hypothetical protein
MSEEDVVENYDEFGMCLEMTEENRVRKFECTFFFSLMSNHEELHIILHLILHCLLYKVGKNR